MGNSHTYHKIPQNEKKHNDNNEIIDKNNINDINGINEINEIDEINRSKIKEALEKFRNILEKAFKNCNDYKEVVNYLRNQKFIVCEIQRKNLNLLSANLDHLAIVGNNINIFIISRTNVLVVVEGYDDVNKK